MTLIGVLNYLNSYLVILSSPVPCVYSSKCGYYWTNKEPKQVECVPLTKMSGQLTFDEYGRPFIIIRDQDKQRRLTGVDAHKVFVQDTVFLTFSRIFLLQRRLLMSFELRLDQRGLIR